MKASEYQVRAARTDLPNYAPVDTRIANDGETGLRLLHAAIGMVTEAGEFIDALKKRLMYGKPLDHTNLKEELGDVMWYIAIACNALGISIEEVMDINIRKLATRYPDKFTEDKALARDLKAEQKVLKRERIHVFVSREDITKAYEVLKNNPNHDSGYVFSGEFVEL